MLKDCFNEIISKFKSKKILFIVDLSGATLKEFILLSNFPAGSLSEEVGEVPISLSILN